MKKIFLLIFVTAICFNAFGQRKLRYKDIYDAFGKEPVEHSALKLSEFQKTNPDFANTYLQLGIISWNWLQLEDPFLNYQYVSKLVYDTKLYLGLAKNKIGLDDKEVKKNKAYYANLNIKSFESLDQQDVVNYIDKLIDKANEYDKNVTKIITNYNTTVDKYNLCIEIYKSVLARQNSYKNLLIMSSPDLRKQMTELSQNFDSVIYYFNEFKSALGNYPIKNYNQTTKIKKISTYRLEGLTSSNFLNEEIPLWDYHTWVSEAFAIMDADINTIKSKTETEIKALRARVAELVKNNAETDSIQEVVAPNRLVNLTEKYDYESLLTSCMKYEVAKANLQIASLRGSNHVEKSESFNEGINQKANYFYDLKLLADVAKSNLNVLKSGITEKNVTKHDAFVTSLYNGKQKFMGSYVADQLKDIDEIQRKNFVNFQSYVVEQINPAENVLEFQKKKIDVKPSKKAFADAELNVYNTVYTIKDENGNRYLSGFLKSSATASYGFVAKVNSDNKVLWVTNVNNGQGGSNNVIQVIPTATEVFAIVFNNNGTSYKSAVVKLDAASGKQGSKTDLASSLCPTVFTYDDINEVASVVFKGNSGNVQTEQTDDCLVETVTLGQKNNVVSGTFQLKGQIVDIINVPNGNIVICNFKELKAGDKSQTSQSNIAVVTFNGSAPSVNFCKSNGDLRAVRAFKVNAETINILGSSDNMDKEISNLSTPNYLLINNKGEFVD